MMTQGNAFKKGMASLAAAVLLAGGLATVGSTTADATTAAPPVPDTAKLAGELANQELAWEKCDYGSDWANQQLANDKVQCATVKVPKDWRNPDPKDTWDIRISQAKNVDVADEDYKGTIFNNPGGPGGPGLYLAAQRQSELTELTDNFNFVGFDPRGVGEDTVQQDVLVGQSSQVKCDYEIEIDAADPNSEKRGIAQACSKDPDVRTFNTEQTAYDMDFIRHLLGAPKLSYLGGSYGTWLGAWYSKIFTKKYADRMVLDSAVDVTQKTLQHTWDLQPISQDRVLAKQVFPALVRNFPDKYPTVEDARRAFYKIPEEVVQVANIVAAEVSGDTSTELVKAALSLRAMDKVGNVNQLSEDEQMNAALDELGKLDNGRYNKIVSRYQTEFDALQNQPESTIDSTTGTFTNVFEVIRCNDGQWNQDLEAWETWRNQVADQVDLFDRDSARLAPPICAFWTANAEMPAADPKTYPKTIVIQGELDPQTAWEAGYETGLKLPRTSFIAVDNESGHVLFPYGRDALDQPVKDFFDTGRLPTNISMVQGKPLVGSSVSALNLGVFPGEENVTYESWEAFRENAHHDGRAVTDVWQVAQEFENGQISRGQSAAGERLQDGQQADREMKEFVFSKYGQRGQDELANG